MRRFATFITVLAFCGCAADSTVVGVISCTVNSECPEALYCGPGNMCVQDCDPADPAAFCGSGFDCDALGRCVSTGECEVNEDCDSPTADARCDGDDLVSPVDPGTCADESGELTCSYDDETTTCENGCVDGACVIGTCDPTECVAPPERTCAANGMTQITFADTGTCENDACAYQEIPVTCGLGCTNGVCVNGACDTVVCNSPPAEKCQGKVIYSYAEQGQCIDSNGAPVCDYELNFQHCGYTGADCENALCVGGITQVGGVVVVEYQVNPVGSFNDLDEWFEIVNTSGQILDLNGWKIQSGKVGGTEEHVIAGIDMLPIDGRFLFGRDAGVVAVDYDYSTITLANNTDWFALVNPDDDIVDYVFYETGSVVAGRSRKLNPSVAQTELSNDDFSNWCPSLEGAYTGAPENYGTPGAVNTACAANPCAGFVCSPPDDFCIESSNTAVAYQSANVMCETSRFNNPFCDYNTISTACATTELCAFGACETIPANVPQAGELVITEHHGNPSGVDTDREWVEVHNTTAGDLSLFSTKFADNESGNSADSFTFLDVNATIPSGAYVVFARNIDPTMNGGVNGAINFSGSHLKNSPDATFKLRLLKNDDTVIDEAFYGTIVSGVARMLDGNVLTNASVATDNDDSSNWCRAQSAYGDGDLGTPGAANPACP